MNMLRFMERLLRLSVPNTAVWLAMFYLVFHLWLNILGELLMFCCSVSLHFRLIGCP
jgi:diacylglycerol O-acyltransferase-1